jgi:MFS family permease
MSKFHSSTQLSDLSPQSRLQPDIQGNDTSATSQHAQHSTGLEASDEAPNNAVEVIPDGGYGWTVVAACSFLIFWINGYTTAWGVLQTAIVKSPNLHTNVRTITFVGSLYMACMVSFGIASIRIMRSYGVRYTALAATLLFGLGLVATSFTLEHLGGLFCVGGLLVGVGTSLLYTATNSLPLQWFSARLGIANGLVKAGGGVGATVLPLAAQALIDKFGLQWTFRIFGILIVATGIPCSLALKERKATGNLSRFDWSLLKNVPFMTLTLAGAVGVFALFVPPFFLPLFASSIGLSASTGAGLVAGFGAATAVGRVFGGWTCDRIGSLNTMLITCLINCLSMLAIWPVSTSLPPLFIFAIVNGCANGSFFVGLPTAVATIAPHSAAASISLMVSFWTPGYLLGTPIAGLLIEAFGAAEAKSIEPYRAAIFYAAGVGILATVLVIISRLHTNKKLFKRV